MIFNGNGNPVLDSVYFNKIFDVQDVQLVDYATEISPQGTTAVVDIPVEVGKGYTANPFLLIFNSTSFWLLDENKNIISAADGIQWVYNTTVKILSETSAYVASYGSAEDARNEENATGYPSTITTQAPIKYLRYRQLVTPTSRNASKWNPSEGWGMTLLEYATESYVPKNVPAALVRDGLEGYWKQFERKVVEVIGGALDVHVVRAEAVRKFNEMRNCIRVATFNIYAGSQPEKWSTISTILADYGVDFAGLQEVHNEYASGDVYPQGLTSQTLPYVDDAESRDKVTPWCENDILSRYPIESSVNVEYENLGGESRGYLKCVIKLPRYKDYYPDGDQYLSLYCTHLDTYVNRNLQAAELRDAMLADTNRFIVAVMDSNDFTATKEAWKIITDAGFKQVHGGTSKTSPGEFTFNASASIDQIFVNENIEVKGYDMVDPRNYMLRDGTTPASDHDMVYADLELLYGDISYEPINPQNVPSTIYHITRNLTHVTDDFVATNVAPNWHYQSTLTAEDGYTISNVTVTMGGVDITASAYSNGVLDFTVTGNVVITATASAS